MTETQLVRPEAQPSATTAEVSTATQASASAAITETAEPAAPTSAKHAAAEPASAAAAQSGRTRTYSWPDPSVPLSRIADRTGLEIFAAMNSGELPIPPIMATLGVDHLDAVAQGQVSVYLQPQEFHYNPLGSVHGGVISMLLDTAAGCAVHTTLPAGMTYTSLDLNARFLKPVTLASGMLRCDGTVISRGRQTALGEAKLYDAAGRLVAHATSTCMLFPIRG